MKIYTYWYGRNGFDLFVVTRGYRYHLYVGSCCGSPGLEIGRAAW